MLLAATASCTPAPQAAVEPANTPISSGSGSAPESATATPTLPPTVMEAATTVPTPTPVPINGQPIQFGGVSFILPTELGTGIMGEIVPASESNDPNNVPYWDLYPDYTDITLVEYPVAGSDHFPQIIVYPADKYAAINPSAGQTITDLKALLADPAADPENMPFLPTWNAAQVFHAQTQRISFTGGKGVRYITMYSQAVMPINNAALFYTFQGLTDDRKYYVAAIFPISTDSLPATAQMDQQEFEALADHYEAYLFQTVDLLKNQTPDQFTPDLTQLDQLIGSIQITMP